MNDIRYLLSTRELLESSDKEKIWEAACAKLDTERLQKINKITHEKKRAESICAGLLLQLGVQELCRTRDVGVIRTEAEMCTVGTEPTDGVETIDSPVRLLTVSQVLALLEAPVEIEYTYGERNKPYFRNFPWYFNLSHSEEYVFCVFSDREVGVDIQYKRSFYNERILRRFFTKEEQELWEHCATPEERETFFYRMWIRKEAYGKLTGEGIGKSVSVNVTDEAEIAKLGVAWEHFDVLSEYQIAVCKGLGKKE